VVRSENPNLRSRSYSELWSHLWHGPLLEQSFYLKSCSTTTFFLRGWGGERKLSHCLPNTSTSYQTIVRSVFAVSCPSCGAPLVLTQTLASRSDQPRADSLRLSTFPSLIPRKMAVFDKTVSLKDPINRGWGQKNILVFEIVFTKFYRHGSDFSLRVESLLKNNGDYALDAWGRVGPSRIIP